MIRPHRDTATRGGAGAVAWGAGEYAFIPQPRRTDRYYLLNRRGSRGGYGPFLTLSMPEPIPSLSAKTGAPPSVFQQVGYFREATRGRQARSLDLPYSTTAGGESLLASLWRVMRPITRPMMRTLALRGSGASE